MSMDCYGELQKARGEYWVLQNRDHSTRIPELFQLHSST